MMLQIRLRKIGQTVDLVPLERTAPAVTEEVTVAETITEAAPAVKDSGVLPNLRL